MDRNEDSTLVETFPPQPITMHTWLFESAYKRACIRLSKSTTSAEH
jgi:hypothetical protein